MDGYLDYVTNVQKLAWRTQDRYRAALERLLDFCKAAEIGATGACNDQTVEDFVRWLRSQTRTRNSKTGKRDVYKVGGVKFILSTCRTAINLSNRRRMMPPYVEEPLQPFSQRPTARSRVGGRRISHFHAEQGEGILPGHATSDESL